MRCTKCKFKEVTGNTIDEKGNILCDACGDVALREEDT